MRVYYASIEYEYLEGSTNYGRYFGGFVYAFVKAKDVLDALPKLIQELESLRLRVKEIEFITPHEDIPWGNNEDQLKYDGLAKEALESDQVVCDDFYAYEEK